MIIGFTGSSGFIGSYLVRALTAGRMGSVRLLLRRLPAAGEEFGAEVVHGDLRSPKDCEQFAKDLDLIIYLAHCNAPVNSDLDQPNDALLNIVPLLNLLQTIRALKTRPHVIYFSSGGATYRRSSHRIPFRETDLSEPSSSYGIQKLAAEHYLKLAAERGHLTCTVLRPGNAYGTLLPQHRMQGLIGVAINNVLHKQPVRVFGSIDNVRDYVHLADIRSIVEKVARPKEPFTILNVGSGQGHSVREVLQTIEECVASPFQIEMAQDPQYGPWLTDWVVLDVSKAQREFNWAPTVNFRDGIRAMVANWRAEAHHQIALA
jgi:UDP-glucose 4-epimerase